MILIRQRAHPSEDAIIVTSLVDKYHSVKVRFSSQWNRRLFWKAEIGILKAVSCHNLKATTFWTNQISLYQLFMDDRNPSRDDSRGWKVYKYSGLWLLLPTLGRGKIFPCINAYINQLSQAYWLFLAHPPCKSFFADISRVLRLSCRAKVWAGLQSYWAVSNTT